MQPTIIIFTGLAATGKTTLSRQVAEALRIPLVAKDDIKEIMYDEIGWSDKAFSAKLARATFRIMDHVTEQHLKTGGSLILEANYSPKLENKKFQAWQEEYDCKIIQVVCRAEPHILARRYFERQHTNRHPGHNDTGTAEEYEIDFHQRIKNSEDQPFSVKGPVLIVDTADVDTVNKEEIIKWVKGHMVIR